MRNARIAVALTLLIAASALRAQRPTPTPPVPPQGTERADAPLDENAEIEKLIVDALAAWRAHDEAKATELLQKAAAKLQARAARNLGTFLPTKAAGWTFQEPDINSGTWGAGETAMQWSNAEVSATKDGDDEKRARIQITNSPQLYQGMQAMVGAQAQMKAILRQQGVDIDVQTKSGFQVLTMVEDGNANAWILGKRIAVMINVDGGNRAMLDAVVGWVDLAGLRRLDGE
ncbi:MAG: hypothetical protein HZB39_10765 [Planctomycetes bacterium]|nr:hypothetical protein [Planctomycetota bacterium]